MRVFARTLRSCYGRIRCRLVLAVKSPEVVSQLTDCIFVGTLIFGKGLIAIGDRARRKKWLM